jgi:hypothetical protein
MNRPAGTAKLAAEEAGALDWFQEEAPRLRAVRRRIGRACTRRHHDHRQRIPPGSDSGVDQALIAFTDQSAFDHTDDRPECAGPATPKRYLSRRSPRLVGEPARRPVPAAGHVDRPPSGIRSSRSRPRHSRCPSGHGEVRANGPRLCQAIGCGGTRPTASLAAARAQGAARRLTRRR